MPKPALSILPQRFAIHRLPPDALLPAAVQSAQFCWTARTNEELSVVCEAGVDLKSSGSERSDNWACFKVAGPLDFAITGLLADLATVLAEAGVSIFALSTYDTDYVLVRWEQLEEAQAALDRANYAVTPITSPHRGE
jgi:hypothetical protein